MGPDVYFLHEDVVENVKDRNVPGLHNGVIKTLELGLKTGKSANELVVNTTIGTTRQFWGSRGQRLFGLRYIPLSSANTLCRTLSDTLCRYGKETPFHEI